MEEQGTPEMPKAVPQREHEWLHELLGEWRWEMDDPNAEDTSQALTGTETVRSLGGLWVVLEGKGEMPGGGEGATMMTLGYDPQKGRFVGTWVGSMMTYLWVYEGTLDAGGKVLSLASEGPDMSGKGGMARYRDVIERIDDDHRTLTGQVFGEDGAWQPMMVVRYTRKR